jgi:hypothetical protein
VIEGPAEGRDVAQFIAYGEKSILLKRLPLSRFEGKFDLSAVGIVQPPY